uniref:C-type lectin domain-containing protein n=1 Tax=Panagrolaimus sp. ES5 TaxID=591445 RepID=A0AC34F7A4_9BILA
MAFLQHFYSIFLLLLIYNVFALNSTKKCHVGWSYLPSTGYCYGSNAAQTSSITWTNAENMCQTFGGHIVTAESVMEFRHILSYFHVSFRNTWFGVWNDNLANGRWNSIDGTVVDFKYIRWCSAHPWVHLGGQRCIGLGYDGTSVCWFDQNCVSDNNMQVVCKAPPIVDVPKSFYPSKYGCKLGWSYLPSTGYCYGANAGKTTSITWTNAENICQSSGGHLVTIESMNEFRHILSYFYVAWRNTWLGVYSNSLAGGKYESIDGTVIEFAKYSRWCRTHPWKQFGGKRCIGFGYDGISVCFFDQNCVTEDNMQMLCKAKPMLLEPPIKEDPAAASPEFEPEANPTIPTIATVATTRKMACYV